MIQAWQVYIIVICPAMAYTAHAWHQLVAERGKGLIMINRL